MEWGGIDCIDLAHSLEKLLWKRLWTCGKSDYLLQQQLLLSITMMIAMRIIMIMIFLDPQKVTLNPHKIFLL
jgi:hypothetical protein